MSDKKSNGTKHPAKSGKGLVTSRHSSQGGNRVLGGSASSSNEGKKGPGKPTLRGKEK